MTRDLLRELEEAVRATYSQGRVTLQHDKVEALIAVARAAQDRFALGEHDAGCTAGMRIGVDPCECGHEALGLALAKLGGAT